jgi:hypothetical protein
MAEPNQLAFRSRTKREAEPRCRPRPFRSVWWFFLQKGVPLLRGGPCQLTDALLTTLAHSSYRPCGRDTWDKDRRTHVKQMGHAGQTGQGSAARRGGLPIPCLAMSGGPSGLGVVTLRSPSHAA